MFSKKPHADIKKSSQKATDPKKDSPTRHKHLKIILDNADPAESKLFFESYFSHVYFVFYDIFLTTEANLKLKVQKSYRDDLDGILQLLEKILILLPELLQKKWQCHSISRVMRKILHPANSVKLRREGIRLFLIWYQILGDHAPDDLHLLFTSLVPDIPVLADYTNPGATSVNPSRPLGLTYAPNYPGREAVDNLSYSSYGSETSGGHSAQHFQESEVGAVLPFDSSCLLPPQPGERSPDNVTTFYLETLMELMISQVTKIEWRDKGTFRQQWCFQFLFDKFKKYYMPHIFPRFDITLNLYRPLPTLPTLRSEDNVIISTDLVDSTMAISGANFGAGMAVAASGQSPPGSPHSALHPHHPQYHQQQLVLQERLAQCQVTIIRWVANFTHNVKKPLTNLEVSRSQVDASVDGNQSEPPSTGQGNDQTAPESVGSGSGAHGSSSVTTLSTTSLIDRESNASFPTVEDHLHFEHMIVRNTLYANRDNVNFVHKVFHQAFLLPFNYSRAIKRVIECYKDWIQMNLSELPVFMLEPLEVNRDDQVHFANQSSASAAVQRQQETSATASETSVVPTTNTNSSFLSVQDVIPRGWRIRNDSYLSAIQLDQLNVRAGLQNMLHIFITNASNLFLLEIGEDRPHALLEEQVDMCKRVLNVYRFMVMNVRMERNTWEQLLNILLRVTSLVLKEHPPSKKEASLGGRLAPALFQTLIVTWIKANLNVVITPELWCNFLSVLSSLTQWEELIREWAKTMETLTRVLARQVYGLDLNDLPLERLSEQKQKKRRGRMHPGDGIKSAGQISTATEDSRTGRGSDASESVPLQRQRIARFNDKVSSSFENGGSDGKEMMTNQSATHERMPRDRLDSNFSFDRESGFVYGKAGHVGSFALVRSNSDGNLTLKKGRRPSLRSSSRESSVTSDGHHRHSHRHHRRMIVEGISPALEQEVERIISNAEEYVRANKQSGYRRDRPFLVKRKSRSVESLSHYHGLDTPPLSVDYSSGAGTPDRSPSPAPSTGIDSNSFKDSPMNLEVIGSSDNSCSNSDVGVEQRSVMAGGNVRGWLPDVAVVLWRRMLGALGDINVIKNPEIHAQVMKYLTDLFETMLKLRNNLGVTSDNQSTPQSPELIPPVTLIIPWLFKTLLLDDDYKEGKLYAYRLLCTLTVRKHDVPLPRQHIVEFYRVLHRGLVGHDQQIINTIVKFCTSRFFFCDLPGSTLLLLDFIFAANTIASSSELENTPRTEAISLLGSLLCFPLHYKTFPVFKPNVSEPTVMACNDAKDHLISVLLKSGKKEPAGLARCIAISSIGIFIYEELIHRSFHVRVKEAIGVLLTGLRVS
ncbi:RALGAPA2 (predicted) [Pycnogonum litorale]